MAETYDMKFSDPVRSPRLAKIGVVEVRIVDSAIPAGFRIEKIPNLIWCRNKAMQHQLAADRR